MYGHNERRIPRCRLTAGGAPQVLPNHPHTVADVSSPLAIEGLRVLSVSASDTASRHVGQAQHACVLTEAMWSSIEMAGLPGREPIARVRDKVEQMAKEQPLLLRRLERCSGPVLDAFHKSRRVPEACSLQSSTSVGLLSNKPLAPRHATRAA